MAFETQYRMDEPARADVDGWPGLTVLEFGAPWCGHCIAIQPALRAVLDDLADLRHVKVEDGRARPLGRTFRVKLWPTLVLLRDGEEVLRLVRPSQADLAGLAEALDAG
ncbi:thioredoxin family protein [Lysobacter sp. A3-1-A15]|uniref:thioredoxin family protein n=1 Tax=Novilysobacter viscosus TaxID=3098602 RepID=UPI002EDA64B3